MNESVKKDNSKKISFWQFLSQYNIVIPIIQRDYAQGRKGKTELRRTFLKDIKNAIDKREPMMLDFIYGSESGKSIAPLDGQQRLTTLWLVHWYIAMKAGKLVGESDEKGTKNDVADKLYKFSYQTRISSRDFCENLCKNNFDEGVTDIQAYIIKQTWFYSAWQLDPTIQSMLRMLKGTTYKDKDGNENEAKDGVEQVFGGLQKEEYEHQWQLLTSEDCPLKFYYLDLLGLKLSDDLYIKMNARGKALSSFENFKADLVGYLANKAKGVNPLKENTNPWTVFNDVANGIPIKLDTTWSQVFWKANKVFWKAENERLSDEKKPKAEFLIDSSYFAFMNRLFFQSIICEKKRSEEVGNDTGDEDKDYLYTSGNINNKDNISFHYLYGPKNPKNNDFLDSEIEYTSFDNYCYLKEGDDIYIPEGFFKSLMAILDNIALFNTQSDSLNETIKKAFPERHKDSKFEFVPVYKRGDEKREATYRVSNISQTDRVIFFALCKYFEKGGYEEKSLKEWMRVVWNLVDDSDVNTVEALVGRIRRIDGIADGARNIYNYLIKELDPSKYNTNSQLEEECRKANAIKEGKVTEDQLLYAENIYPFNGKIRFLYQADNRFVDDWGDNFNTKLQNAEAIFHDIYPSEEGRRTITTRADYLIRLFACIQETGIMDKLDFSNRRILNNFDTTWMFYLTSAFMSKPVAEFLLEKCNSTIEKIGEDAPPYSKGSNSFLHYYFSHRGLLDFVVKKIPYSWIRDYHNHYAIYPSSPGVFLNAQVRDKLLASKDFILGDGVKVPNTTFLYGSDIDFKYNGHSYRWYRNDNIYLMRDDKPWEYKVKKTGHEENDNYYCFKFKLEMEGKLKDELNKLYEECENDRMKLKDN